MFDRKSSVVFEGNIPVNMRRGSSTMTVLLTPMDKSHEQGLDCLSGDKIEAIDEEDDETGSDVTVLDHGAAETRRSSGPASVHSSTHTLQVPQYLGDFHHFVGGSRRRNNSFDLDLELRRRSLSCLPEHQTSSSTRSSVGDIVTPLRRSSAPYSSARRSSSGWGPIWELRKQFLHHRRRQSSEDFGQVGFELLFGWKDKKLLTKKRVSLCCVCVATTFESISNPNSMRCGEVIIGEKGSEARRREKLLRINGDKC